MDGFKIMCQNCGLEIIVKDDTNNSNYKGKFMFYPIQNSKINICCMNCNNEVYIDEN